MTRSPHPRYRGRRDRRLPIIFAVLLVGVLAWVAVGPLAIGPWSGSSPVAAITATQTPTPTPTPTPTATIARLVISGRA